MLPTQDVKESSNKQTTTTTSKSSGLVSLETLESGVALLRLGGIDEKVVSLTVARLQSLREAIQKLKNDKPKGLIIMGPSNDMFTVGADIKLIQEVKDPSQGEKLAREGQLVFSELESLPFPTIAAISGPCVGGGCELVLACKMRIISDNKSSTIGLPEIKLGIIPGFGGTQRLPRIVGLPKALDIILAGKTLKPRQALSCGLVQEIVPVSKLKDRAEAAILGNAKLKAPRLKLIDKVLTFTGFGRNIVRKKAEPAMRKETKGFYPAPPAALAATLLGLERGLDEGLKFEAKELGRMIVTPESKSLVRIFFLTEAAKGLGRSARKSVEHVHGLVIGAGTMGAGIAGVLAKNECSVILKDSNDEALKRGQQQIRTYVDKLKYLSEAEKSFILNRVELASRESTNTGNVNIAIEAVFEDMDLKKRLLGDISKVIAQDAIIASNTSSLSIAELATGIDRPERVIGMHFFNPVDKMPLIEIVIGKKTSDKAIAMVAALTAKLGKFPIVVQDVPGFLVNRILCPYLNEAAFLLSEGYSIEDIDKAATSFGMPMGPIRLLDEVGLDVAEHVAEIMKKGYGPRMDGPGFAKALATIGRKGKKSNNGFYDFTPESTKPCPEIRKHLAITAPEKHVADLSPITERLMLSLINEAVRCLDEGVAGIPGPEAAAQIDLGMVMGIGFPPFRGGLLYYADTLGSAKVLSKLEALEKTHGLRFQPTEGIRERAKSAKSFLGKV